MSELSEDEVQEILANWAEDSRELPPPVRDVYDAWYNFRFAEIKSAIEAMSADDDFACEMGEGQVPSRAEMARLLTVHGWDAVPAGVEKPPADELRSVIKYTRADDNDPNLRALALSMRGELKRAQETIQSLSRSSSVDGDIDVAGDYDIADAVL